MLTANQQRHIRSLLAHIEHEVEEGISALEDEDPEALFPRYRNYPVRTRIEMLRQQLVRLRSLMRRFMDAQAMTGTESPAIDAAWGFQTRMEMTGNAVLELRPSFVRGYGELDAAGEQDCRALSAELSLLLGDIARELHRQPLQLPPEHAKNALLAVLADVIERHQLLEFRGSLQSLLAEGESDRVEVAILGRVSSGKSSLANALLEQPLLPVGAIPVTAVVTRIRYGGALRIKAVDVEGEVQEVATAQLPQYISERGAFNNHQRLREVTIEMPAAILQGGVVLADTPGLGSLHPRAAAHALSYLPRCDLGIIAIDASATLSQQDVDLALALQQAGASRLVVLTKSDTVSATALEQQRGYVASQLSQALPEPVEVASLSVDAAHLNTLQRWRDGPLAQALARGASDSGARGQHRLATLARRVGAVLEQALHENAPARSRSSSERQSGSALAALADVERSSRILVADLGTRGAGVVLDDTLRVATTDTSDVPASIQAAAGQLADEVVREVLAALKRAVENLEDKQVAPLLRGLPPFVLTLPQPSKDYRVSGFRAWRRFRLRRRLPEDFQTPLHDAFLAYGAELNAWLARILPQLRQIAGYETVAVPSIKSRKAAIRTDLERIHELVAGGTSSTKSAPPT